jgi:hypothetical protein
MRPLRLRTLPLRPPPTLHLLLMPLLRPPMLQLLRQMPPLPLRQPTPVCRWNARTT